MQHNHTSRVLSKFLWCCGSGLDILSISCRASTGGDSTWQSSLSRSSSFSCSSLASSGSSVYWNFCTLLVFSSPTGLPAAGGNYNSKNDSFGRTDAMKYTGGNYNSKNDSFGKTDAMKYTGGNYNSKNDSFGRTDAMKYTGGNYNSKNDSFGRTDAMKYTWGNYNNKNDSFGRTDAMKYNLKKIQSVIIRVQNVFLTGLLIIFADRRVYVRVWVDVSGWLPDKCWNLAGYEMSLVVL